MAKKPCKVKYKLKGKDYEMTMAEFMTELRNGLLQEMLDSGIIDPQPLKGEFGAVEEPKRPVPPTTPPTTPPTEEESERQIKKRKFTTTIQNDPGIRDEIKLGFSEGAINYETLPNKITVAEATKIVDADEDMAREMMNNPSLPSAIRFTIGQVLIKRYNQSGRDADAVEVAEEVVRRATDYGQAIQALSLFGRLTPEGTIIAVTRAIKKQREKQVKKYEAEAKDLKESLNNARKEAATEVANVVPKTTEKKEAKVKPRPSSWGSKNKIVTKEAYLKAKEELSKKLFSAAIPPPELIKIGVYHIEAGARTFAEFAKRIAEDFGNRFDDVLQDAYDLAVNQIDADKKQNELNKKSKKFGNLMSGRIPQTTDRRTKLEKLKELADELDAENGGTVYNDLYDEYKSILDQEQADKDAAKAQKKLDNLVASMSTEAGVLKGLRGMGVKIQELIKSHYSKVDQTKQDLIDKFISEAGLSGAEADALATKVEAEFDRIIQEKRDAAIKRYLPRAKTEKNKKAAYQKLVEASNVGAVDLATVNDAIAEALDLGGNVSPEDAKKLQELANKVQEAKTEREQQRAIQDLLSYQENMKGFSYMDALQSFWMSSILSGIPTQTINIIANLYNMAALIGGMATQRNVSRRLIAKGLMVGLKRGLFEGADTLRTGYSPLKNKEDIPDILERIRFKGGAFNPANYAKFVRRFMTAADVVFYEGLRQARSFQMAYKEAAKDPSNKSATNKELRDKALEKLNRSDSSLKKARDQAKAEYETKMDEIFDMWDDGKIDKKERDRLYKQAKLDERFRIHELLEENRSAGITEEASDFAARGTFNHPPNGLLGMLSQYMNAASSSWKPLKFVIPFVNVISNVANETLNYTPVGAVRAARAGGTLTGLKPIEDWNSQKRTDLIIKSVQGTMLMTAALILSQAGDDDDDEEPILEVTANGFGDYGKNEELKQTGWEPYSFRVKNPATGEYGPWISYKMTPFMVGLSFVGGLRDAKKYKEEDLLKGDASKLGLASTALVRSFANQTFLSSGEDFLSIIFDERNKDMMDGLGEWAKKTATGGIVPAIISKTSQQIQDVMDIPQKEIKDTYFGRMLRDIPVARNNYDDKLNGFGDPVEYDQDLIYSTAEGKPEDRLWNLVTSKGQTIGLPQVPETYVNEDDQEVQMTPQDNYNYQKFRGGYIKNALEQNFDALEALPKDKFKEYLSDLKGRASSLAKASLPNDQEGYQESFEKLLKKEAKKIEDVMKPKKKD